MEIGTFGAVFQAAVALEEQLMKRYEAQSAHQPGPVQEVYRALAADGAKRLKRLERTRRETVTEMILEPLHDLQMSDDLAGLVTTGAGAPLTPEAARRLELSAAAFYNDAAEKIGLAEAARALRRLGKENTKRAEQLARVL